MTASPSRRGSGIGLGLTVVVAGFLLIDAGMKLAQVPVSVTTMAQLGWPASTVMALGIVLAVCTLLYCIPATSILGAVLVTAYLGGAVATHARIGSPMATHTLFGVYLGVAMWASLFLREARLRALLPIRAT